MQRAWCFTLNNPKTLLDFDDFTHLRYGVYQMEIGEEGTEHFQGYLEFSTPKRLAAMKKFIPGAHFEARKGTREQARDYCMKADTRIDGPYEHGDFSAGGAGKRTDLAQVYEAIKQGKTEMEILDTFPTSFMKYYRGIREAKQLKSVQRNWPMEVHFYFGDTGTGKSRKAFAENPNAYWVQRSKSATGWWDGYHGHEVIIIDDFYGWLSFDFMLRLLDRYPLMLETKGGQTQCLAKKIILTSNKPPEHVYSDEKFNLAPFLRRITHFWWFNRPKACHVKSNWNPIVVLGDRFPEGWELFRETITDFTRNSFSSTNQ